MTSYDSNEKRLNPDIAVRLRRMAREANVYDAAESELNLDYTFTGKDLERFAALIAAAEREACARVCEKLHIKHFADDPHGCVLAIRARGNDE